MAEKHYFGHIRWINKYFQKYHLSQQSLKNENKKQKNPAASDRLEPLTSPVDSQTRQSIAHQGPADRATKAQAPSTSKMQSNNKTKILTT